MHNQTNKSSYMEEHSTSISFLIHPSSSTSSYSSSSRRSYKSLFGPEYHFLDFCHLCKKYLDDGKDIYMYKGDTPFCSEDCRQEQIDIDEAVNENNRKLNQIKKSKNSGIVIYSETKRVVAAAAAS